MYALTHRLPAFPRADAVATLVGDAAPLMEKEKKIASDVEGKDETSPLGRSFVNSSLSFHFVAASTHRGRGDLVHARSTRS